jgi:hypothetical protein
LAGRLIPLTVSSPLPLSAHTATPPLRQTFIITDTRLRSNLIHIRLAAFFSHYSDDDDAVLTTKIVVVVTVTAATPPLKLITLSKLLPCKTDNWGHRGAGIVDTTTK